MVGALTMFDAYFWQNTMCLSCFRHQSWPFTSRVWHLLGWLWPVDIETLVWLLTVFFPTYDLHMQIIADRDHVMLGATPGPNLGHPTRFPFRIWSIWASQGLIRVLYECTPWIQHQKPKHIKTTKRTLLERRFCWSWPFFEAGKIIGWILPSSP